MGTWLATGRGAELRPRKKKRDPFKYFKTSAEIIRLAMMLHVRFAAKARESDK